MTIITIIIIITDLLSNYQFKLYCNGLNLWLHKSNVVKCDPYCNKGGGCRVLVLYQQSFYWELNLRSAFYPFVQVDQQLHDLVEEAQKVSWWFSYIKTNQHSLAKLRTL